MKCSFRLLPNDARVKEWLESIPEGERSFHIRQVLRNYVGEAAHSLTQPPPATDQGEHSPPQLPPQSTESKGKDLTKKLDKLANSF